MSFTYLQKIPTPKEILQEIPLSAALKKIKAIRDKDIIDVLCGRLDKFLLIIGPCSADNQAALLEYVSRLSKLQAEVKDKLILIPRIYTNKPRTTGAGYKGMMHQPKRLEEPNISKGIKAIRRMHIRSLEESGLSAADEMLYPGNYPYLDDILSYVTIGARSVENQEHRLTVSGLDIPVGMKNPTSGDFNVLLNSVQAAQMSHTFVYNGWEVKTKGNPLVHCILRGAVNQHGQCIPNYHYEDLMRFVELYLKRNFSNPAVIVDTNHANSNKNFRQQPRIAEELINSINISKPLKTIIKGLMVESYLEEGAQDITGNVFGQSITDSCLGWTDTKKMVLRLAQSL
ncbi:MAG: 3-deoxy-7-phosphoheptulonate synthase [Candidatus Omnitrophica bacterium]|jgi:3-deoxy-7-phosphoheptulonate synthase|nr:3-deoxy-7-phosphoheptulonate synthase [Candidatus Omnitrophota bacterium]